MSRKIGLGDTHFDHDIDGDIDFDFFGDGESTTVKNEHGRSAKNGLTDSNHVSPPSSNHQQQLKTELLRETSLTNGRINNEITYTDHQWLNTTNGTTNHAVVSPKNEIDINGLVNQDAKNHSVTTDQQLVTQINRWPADSAILHPSNSNGIAAQRERSGDCDNGYDHVSGLINRSVDYGDDANDLSVHGTEKTVSTWRNSPEKLPSGDEIVSDRMETNNCSLLDAEVDVDHDRRTKNRDAIIRNRAATTATPAIGLLTRVDDSNNSLTNHQLYQPSSLHSQSQFHRDYTEIDQESSVDQQQLNLNHERDEQQQQQLRRNSIELNAVASSRLVSASSPLFVEVDNDSASDLYSLSDTDSSEVDDSDESLDDDFSGAGRRTTSGYYDYEDDNFESDITDVSPLSSANMSPLPPHESTAATPSTGYRRPRSTSLPPGSQPTLQPLIAVRGTALTAGRAANRLRPKSCSVGASPNYFRSAGESNAANYGGNRTSQVLDKVVATLPRVRQAGNSVPAAEEAGNGNDQSTDSSDDEDNSGNGQSGGRQDAVDLKVLSKAISELEEERRRAPATSGRRSGNFRSLANGDVLNGHAGSLCSTATGTSVGGNRGGGSVSGGSASGRTSLMTSSLSSATSSSCARPRRNMTFNNEEARRIEQENKRLLRRIMDSSRPRRAPAPITGRVASSTINRLRDIRRIESENLSLLRRLHAAKPTKELSRDYLMNATSSRRAPSHLPSMASSKSSGSLASTRTTSPFVAGGPTSGFTASGTGGGCRNRPARHSRSTGHLHSSSAVSESSVAPSPEVSCASSAASTSRRSAESPRTNSGATSATEAPSIDGDDDNDEGSENDDERESLEAETPRTPPRER